MHQRPTLSYDEASAYVAAALDAARAEHGPAAAIACAVVGSAGELIAYGAHDGTGVLPRRLAPRKAYSAVLFKRDTAAVAAAVAAGVTPIARLGDVDLLDVPGGAPIVVDGTIVGGIGVSGMAPAEDGAIAAQVAATRTA